MPSTPLRDKGKQREMVELIAALSPLPLPLPTSSVTQTYTAKSRSFLVTIPASSHDPNSIGDNKDDFISPESYTCHYVQNLKVVEPDAVPNPLLHLPLPAPNVTCAYVVRSSFRFLPSGLS